MPKETPLGNATDAQSALETVARCAAVLGANAPSYADIAAPPPGSSLRGWLQAVATDGESGTFAFAGLFGGHTVGLVRKPVSPESVVYKVMLNPFAGWYAAEKATFQTLDAQGRAWLTEWCDYPTQKVIAILNYERYAKAGNVITHGGSTVPTASGPEFTEMVAAGVDASAGNLGLRADGKLVFIDGRDGI